MKKLVSFSVLQLTHQFLASNIEKGDICIDATAGNGHDTAFLCELVGENGMVHAFDIQEQAIKNTQKLLEEKGLAERATLHLIGHEHMNEFVEKESVAAIDFNFGWLPGGDHDIFTKAQTSVAAVKAGLDLLKPGGVMSLAIYYGRNNGYSERDALLEFCKTIDNKQYTVLTSYFSNRDGEPPIPVFIMKDERRT